jgi:hypothetical protein
MVSKRVNKGMWVGGFGTNGGTLGSYCYFFYFLPIVPMCGKLGVPGIIDDKSPLTCYDLELYTCLFRVAPWILVLSE